MTLKVFPPGHRDSLLAPLPEGRGLVVGSKQDLDLVNCWLSSCARHFPEDIRAMVTEETPALLAFRLFEFFTIEE